jgi:hypothetical protein
MGQWLFMIDFLAVILFQSPPKVVLKENSVAIMLIANHF